MSKLFGVAGNPILHSKSPIIHKAILKQNNIEYLRLHGESFSEIISLCKYLGVKGINVTSPFKEYAYHACNLLSDDAKKTCSVNTLLFKDDKIIGENTDVFGVVTSLKEAEAFHKNFSYLIIGAGGAAKSALKALEGMNVILTHRNSAKGAELANKFGAQYSDIFKLNPESFDVIVSTVSDPSFLLPEGFLMKKHFFLNAIYSSNALSNEAKEVGCKIISGERWLLHQAQRAADLFYDEKGDISEIEYVLKKSERKNKPIALIGMMGAGKSSVSKILCKLMNYSCVELDIVIEEKFNKSIPEIFTEFGESTFRELESRCLREVSIDSSTVLACGGGIVLDPQNQKYLKEHFTVIWLFASDGELTKRLQNEIHTRPILQRTTISELQKARMNLYAKTSDIVFLTDGHDIEGIAKIISDEIQTCRK